MGAREKMRTAFTLYEKGKDYTHYKPGRSAEKLFFLLLCRVFPGEITLPDLSASDEEYMSDLWVDHWLLYYNNGDGVAGMWDELLKKQSLVSYHVCNIYTDMEQSELDERVDDMLGDMELIEGIDAFREELFGYLDEYSYSDFDSEILMIRFDSIAKFSSWNQVVDEEDRGFLQEVCCWVDELLYSCFCGTGAFNGVTSKYLSSNKCYLFALACPDYGTDDSGVPVFLGIFVYFLIYAVCEGIKNLNEKYHFLQEVK